MEDIEVAFSPTGDGWLYINHPFERIVERFKWEIDNSGLIQIDGVASAAFYDIIPNPNIQQSRQCWKTWPNFK